MQKKLRIIFMGTPEFAVPSLQALIDSPETVVAVVTQPDRPKGRGRKMTSPPIKLLAEKASIPVLQPTKVKTKEFQDELLSYSADVIVVTAYGRILVDEVLGITPFGCINVHGSLLPKYRGAAPIHWAILNGDLETGITIMQMNKGVDTGDILLSKNIPITDSDTTNTLAKKLSQLGGELLVNTLKSLKDGILFPVKQNEAEATYAPILKKEIGIIDWHKPARSISCQIRGLDPWPLASTFLKGKSLRLFQPEVINEVSSELPGTIIKADSNGLLLSTGHNLLLIKEIQKEGSKRMPVQSFLLGNKLDIGEKLGK